MKKFVLGLAVIGIFVCMVVSLRNSPAPIPEAEWDIALASMTMTDPLGACCINYNSIVYCFDDWLEVYCIIANGNWHNGDDCSTLSIQQCDIDYDEIATGSCCWEEDDCQEDITEYNCLAFMGGNWIEDGLCSASPCEDGEMAAQFEILDSNQDCDLAWMTRAIDWEDWMGYATAHREEDCGPEACIQDYNLYYPLTLVSGCGIQANTDALGIFTGVIEWQYLPWTVCLVENNGSFNPITDCGPPANWIPECVPCPE